MPIFQISDICWSPSYSYLNKRQFFAALKLVASYQANISVTSQVVTSKIDLPHPRFSWTSTEKQRSPVHDLIELQSDVNNYIKQVNILSNKNLIQN